MLYHTHTYTYTYTNTKYTNTYIQIHIYKYIYTNTHTHRCTSVCTQSCLHVYIYCIYQQNIHSIDLLRKKFSKQRWTVKGLFGKILIVIVDILLEQQPGGAAILLPWEHSDLSLVRDQRVLPGSVYCVCRGPGCCGMWIHHGHNYCLERSRHVSGFLH